MVAVQTIALLLGLIGFAFHVFWAGSIVVLALGLGYVIASSRKDRIEVLSRRGEHANSTG